MNTVYADRFNELLHSGNLGHVSIFVIRDLVRDHDEQREKMHKLKVMLKKIN